MSIVDPMMKIFSWHGSDQKIYRKTIENPLKEREIKQTIFFVTNSFEDQI